jgi:hypothetical protein
MTRVLPLSVVSASLRPMAGQGAGAIYRRHAGDWTEVIRFANEHLVAPAMYSMLTRNGAMNLLPDDVHLYLDFLHRTNGERNHVLRRQACEVVSALNAQGITPMLLKGALALFLDHYNDPAARMIGDIDLLVRPRDLRAAIGALTTLGYEVRTRYAPVQHAYAEFVRPGAAGAIDLHVDILDTDYLLSADDVWPRAHERRDAGCSFAVPAATDMLLHNLWHAQIHHREGFYRGLLSLRQVYDFAVIARRYETRIEWERIEDCACRHGLGTALQSYLLAASLLFELPWPLHEPPSLAARVHWARCQLQLRYPWLDWLGMPWANIRAAFAGHRMKALYGNGWIAALQLRHAAAFFLKRERQSFFGRLFKAR